MTCREWDSSRAVRSFSVFFACCHTASDVAFLLVDIQNLTYLYIEVSIYLGKPLGEILMYGGFGNAKILRRGADSGTSFNHVHSQFTGTFVKIFFHAQPSDAVCG